MLICSHITYIKYICFILYVRSTGANRAASRINMDSLQRGVQWMGGAVDGGSIM